MSLYRLLPATKMIMQHTLMELFLSWFPVLLLVFLMTKKQALPANQSLPLCALVTYCLTIFYFSFDVTLVHAVVIKGLLVAWTPILIIASAIFLFKTLEATGSLAIIRTELNNVTRNQVAQLMILGWAFPFLIEGASGFGTPAAIAAPILVGLGFNPLRVAVLTLIMNSVPVSFGAVGTPTWFGFSALDLSAADNLTIGFKTALIHSIIALFIPILALVQIIKWQSIKQNLLFIFLSIVATVLPYLTIAQVDYEFPSLVGGGIGLVVTILLAKYGIGLSKSSVLCRAGAVQKPETSNTLHTPAKAVSIHNDISRSRKLLLATFPIWGTILLLIITRVPQLGVKAMLTSVEGGISQSVGLLGEFSISQALVLNLSNILGTHENWQHALLYVPSIVPFVAIALTAMLLMKTGVTMVWQLSHETAQKMAKPTISLFGALVFVNLMMMGGETSLVNSIGKSLASLSGENWVFLSPFLGALGSFFSGSATISNLTFSGIQYSIAQDIGLNITTILALQSVGAALGNMVCIANIVAVCTVLGLEKAEGKILKRTAFPMLLYGSAAGVIGFLML